MRIIRKGDIIMFSQKEKSVLYEAFDMYYAEYCNTLPTKEELSYITFSKEFEDKMEKLIAREKKFYYYWINTVGKRVAMIITAILISLTSITFGVKAIREPVIRFIVETFEKFSNVIFVKDISDEESSDYEFVFVKTYPTYIPEEFVVESNYEDEVKYKLVYSNSEKTAMFMYMQAINSEGVLQANTENVTYENIVINNSNAIYYSNKGTNTIIFNTKEYVFTIEGNISKDELIKIAESIK